MLLGIGVSKNNIKIRLTQERWNHITNSHPEINPKDFPHILKVIQKPDIILEGDRDELLAVKKKKGVKIWFVVPYKEISDEDGFILTAYLTTDLSWLLKRKVIWIKK